MTTTRARRVRNRAPVYLVACPVHGRKVALDGEGRVLGKCDGCATEAAQALTQLRRTRRRARLVVA